jgi:hypothetical protein
MHDYRWIDSDEASYLHWGYACVATVAADGAVSITGWYRPVGARAASRAQGKRFVLRWIGKHGAPWGGRLREMRERRGLPDSPRAGRDG